MKGDFSKLGFDKTKQYTHVNMQQGRLLVDKDWNEQQDIIDYRLRTNLQDLVGLHGTPKGNSGFKITLTNSNKAVTIKAGRYYVSGVLCENQADCSFEQQPYIDKLALPQTDGDYLMFLDAWQQSINYLHQPDLLDSALASANKIDTTTRQQTMWQVNYLKLDGTENAEARQALLNALSVKPTAQLTITQTNTGTLNQLLRLEVHKAYKDTSKLDIKWDMENSSRIAKTIVQAEKLPTGNLVVRMPNNKHGLQPKAGEWIELRTKEQEYLDQPGVIAKIASFDTTTQILELTGVVASEAELQVILTVTSLFLRQWTGFEQNVAINSTKLLTGTDINVAVNALSNIGTYWYIALRKGEKANQILQPCITWHHYAPLAKIKKTGTSYEMVAEDRYEFAPLTNLASQIQNSGSAGTSNESSTGTVTTTTTTQAPLSADAVKTSQIQIGRITLTEYLLQNIMNYVADYNNQQKPINWLSNRVPVAFSGDSRYIIDQNGLLWVTGKNDNGALGNGYSTGITYDWTNIPNLPPLAKIVKGDKCAYAVTETGTLWVTGKNNQGQLGNNSTTDLTNWQQIILSGLAKINKVVAGTNGAYLITDAGELWVTGDNTYGQLGAGAATQVNQWQKIAVTGLSAVSNITLDSGSAYLITTDGKLWITGQNDVTQLGNNSSTNVKTWQQIVVTNFTGINKVVTAAGSAYALTQAGEIWVTGKNNQGQLGAGSTTNLPQWQKISVTGMPKILNLVVVSGSAYAISEFGELWVTGNNSSTQLGTGNTTNLTTWKLINNVVGFSRINQLIAVTGAAYALTEYGELWVTGANPKGQLGNGSNSNVMSWQKIAVTGLQGIKTLVTVMQSAYLLTSAGEVWVTGSNQYGQLGTIQNNKVDTDNTKYIDTWQKISDLTKVISIDTDKNTCAYAISSDRKFWLAGQNDAGQIGTGIKTNTMAWVQIAVALITQDTTQVLQSQTKTTAYNKLPVVSGDNAAYLRDANNSFWVTGRNYYGQLGTGLSSGATTPANLSTWTNLTMVPKVREMVIGYNEIYAITEAGDLWVSGYNYYGELGVGTTGSSSGTGAQVNQWVMIQDVTKTSKIREIKLAGSSYTSAYAVTEAGDLWVSGYNGNGQLGVGSTTNIMKWQAVAGFKVKQLVLRNNASNSCSAYVITDTDELWVAGYNGNGQLGVGNTSNVTTWTKVSGLSQAGVKVREIVAPSYDQPWLRNDGDVNQSIYLISTTGDLWVAGYNAYGQLGLGNTSNVTTWAKITAVTKVKIVDFKAIGIASSAYLINEAGELWVSGYNYYGQLGLGHSNDVTSWTKIDAITGVKSVVPQYNYSAYVITDAGQLWVAGYNNNGQMGVGSITNVLSWTDVTKKVTDMGKVSEVYVPYYSYAYAIARTTTGDLWVAGCNTNGELGIGSIINATSWTKITTVTKVSKVFINGYYSSYVLTDTGELWVTGYNNYGQLGIGGSSTSNVLSWTKVTSVSAVSNLVFDVNSSQSVFAITSNNEVWAAGLNSSGQLGLGDTSNKFAFTNTKLKV